MYKNIFLCILCLGLTLTFSGCEKNKPEELPRLPGIQTSISDIQITPLAYDRAIVTLRGIVTDIKDIGDSGNRHRIIISDRYENTLDLEYSGDTRNISTGNMVVVSGIYDKASNSVITDRIAKIPLNPDK